ncbi:MAG: TlpA family protein disulfide reductase [Odoribacter splanchnicus]
MKYCCLFFVLLLTMSCSSKVRTVFCGSVLLDDATYCYNLTLRGVDSSYQLKSSSDGRFHVVIPSGSPYFYLEGMWQHKDGSRYVLNSPVYLAEGDSLSINILSGNHNRVDIKTENKINRVFQDFRVYHEKQMAELWDNSPHPNKLVDWTMEYCQQVQQIFKKQNVSAEVAEYLGTWQGLEYINLLKGLQYLYPSDDSFCFPQELIGQSPDLAQILDKVYWKVFPNSSLNIFLYLQNQTKIPEEQLVLLKARFHNLAIQREITQVIVSRFLKRSSYSEENLVRLEKLCEGIQNREEILTQYRKRAFTQSGAVMPDVTFVDINGQQHQLSEFRGKYVYIDLWASWCGPCCQEIPYIEKLKSELNSKQVVFVCISLDKNQSKWKEKMEQLNMTGNQWLDFNGEFAKILNISSIPHFLLYDKEGKLLEYRSMAPSQPALKSKLEQLH